jgi:DNA repair exonuclease SbcCD ATPase subunit
MSLEQIGLYLKESYLSEHAKKFLDEIKDLMAQLAGQDRIYKESQQEYQRLAEDQNRFRQNMGTLNVNNPKEQEVREKYVSKLEKVEDQIGTLHERMLAAQDKKAELERQLGKMIQEFKEE